MSDINKILEDLKNKRTEVLGHYDEWREKYPEFKKISDIMENFKTNELLIQYLKNSLPTFVRDRAIEIYKKCLSYKVKLKMHKIDKLGYSYTPEPYCIDAKKVKLFTDDYQAWGRKSYNKWNDVYYLNQDFFLNKGYTYNWDFNVKYNMLKYDLEKIEKIYNETIEFLNSGIDLVNKHDDAITLEYSNNSFEMSFYEREEEIKNSPESFEGADDEYCYVYTLECELFVFYVGIAANPRERFEQHIRGAFSDEAHLFKSKFIQKYHNEVKQNIVFEGLRRECKKFEKNYIAEHNPLGNMTVGGEG